MTVTVLLPVYNAAATLPQALRSILHQQHRDFELLIIDDASTDGSGTVIDHYARRDSRIVPVAHERNAGLASTLHEGLERARYEFVARMDADDEALPHRLVRQIAFLETHPHVAAVGSWVYHMGSQRRYDRLIRLPVDHDEIVAILESGDNCMYHPTMMLRRSAVLDVGGYRGFFKNSEDYDLWLRLGRRYELANMAEPLLRYRFSVAGMTLGRKWEQYFYVHLAQAAGPEVPLDAALQRAEATFAEVGRTRFLTQVALGTLRELVALHQWRTAAALIAQFSREIGRRQTRGALSGDSPGAGATEPRFVARERD